MEATTLARPYAKAAFSAACDSKALDRWSDALATAAATAAHPKVAGELASPSHGAGAKAAMLVDLAEGNFDSSFVSFLQVLADNNRLSLLADIREVFESLKAQLEQFVDVNVSSAFELSDEAVGNLKQALAKKLGTDINISTLVDSDLIGGVVIRAGDTVIDGSIKGRLAKLATVMNS